MFKFIPTLILGAAISWAATTRAAEPVAISGITEPFLDVTLGLANAGIISAQFFKEGDIVKKGDAVLELDKIWKHSKSPAARPSWSKTKGFMIRRAS